MLRPKRTQLHHPASSRAPGSHAAATCLMPATPRPPARQPTRSSRASTSVSVLPCFLAFYAYPAVTRCRLMSHAHLQRHAATPSRHDVRVPWRAPLVLPRHHTRTLPSRAPCPPGTQHHLLTSSTQSLFACRYQQFRDASHGFRAFTYRVTSCCLRPRGGTAPKPGRRRCGAGRRCAPRAPWPGECPPPRSRSRSAAGRQP